MTITKEQEKLFKSGAELAKQYPGFSFKNALYYIAYEQLEELDGNKNMVFFEAGFNGREPEWVTAIRYGEIPVSGYSTNWATGERENGVSCLSIVRKESDYDLIHPVYEIAGTQKIIIEGWYFGKYGSDGEPLLHFATKKSDYNK